MQQNNDDQPLGQIREDLDCVHTMPADFENGKNVTDRPPVHTKTAYFLPADFENGRF